MSTIDFEAPFTLTGDVTVETDDSSSMRVWLGSAIGSVKDGIYRDSSIITTGTGLGIYVRRNGKAVGTIKIDLGGLVAQAIAIFEEKAK